MNQDQIRADFDRIAQLPNDSDEDDWLLSLVPERMRSALEIGCGQGRFARKLASRAEKVIAVDLSPKMIEAAKRNTPPNVEFIVGEGVSGGEYDCAIAIATLHHMDFVETLKQLARALRPGGVLVVHDLYAEGKVSDYLLNLPEWLRRKLRRERVSEEAKAAWAEHAKHDHFLALEEIRAGAKILPGAQVRRHAWWRYTLVWRKN
jgi:SAM-dependent methyltransferase